MPRYYVTISSTSGQAMADLVRKHHIQVLDHGQKSTESGFLVQAIAEPSEIQKLRNAGYTVEQRGDVDELGKARQKEVGRGNRYKDKDKDKEKKPY